MSEGSNKIQKKQCDKCNGSGYMEHEIKTCPTCNGPVSMNGKNIDVSHKISYDTYYTCDKCYGCGEI